MKTKSLPIPEGVLTQNIIAFGKPGSGKSSKLRVLIEHLLDQGKTPCIIDPKGDWFGLKLSADGEGAGYPIIIFGGEHGDIPINECAGTQVAEVVAMGRYACIIDFGGWMPGERARFFTDFASKIFRIPHPPLHLVIDEVHNFAPQGKVEGMGAKSLHWANRLASEGRSKGITLLAASQRPQKVHKDLVTTCETLIAGRVIHKLDRDAVGDWIKGCADPDTGKQVINELASMPRNEAWVWSPEINFGPERIAFPLFKTFDSFSPQAALRDFVLPPALGLDEIKRKLGKVVHEATANDPKQLKDQIAELQKQKITDEKMINRLNSIIEGNRKRIDELMSAALAPQQIIQQDDTARSALSKILQLANKALGQECIVDKDEINGADNFSPVMIKPKPQQISALKTERTNAVSPSTITSTLSQPEQKVINAIAWYMVAKVPEPYTKRQVAAVAGYSPNSGGFNNLLGKLRTAGLIEYPAPGAIRLTDYGWTMTEPVKAPGSSAELHDMIKTKLTGPQWKVLQAALMYYPSATSKATIADDTGYSVNSGGFNNLLGSLRSLGLIDYPKPGQVKAEDILFIH